MTELDSVTERNSTVVFAISDWLMVVLLMSYHIVIDLCLAY